MPLDSHVPLTDAVVQERPVWLSSREDLRARYPELEPHTVSSAAAALPLMVKGRVLGTIGLSFGQEHRFNEDDRAFFTAVAHACAQAIDRAQLYEEERLANERVRAAAARLQVLAEASDAFSAANRDLPALFEAITQQVVRHLGDSCILTLRMPDQELLETVSVRHVDPSIQERMQQVLAATPIKLGEGLKGRVAQTGQSLLSASSPWRSCCAESRAGVLPRARAHRHLLLPRRAAAGAGPRHRHAVHRALHPGAPFNREDLRLMEELANKAALSIENARFFQQQQRDQEELRRRTEFEQQLIGIVCHDLRNPLGAILMAARAAQAAGAGRAGAQGGSRIPSRAERATRLIRDLLDFTQARLGGGIPLQRAGHGPARGDAPRGGRGAAGATRSGSVQVSRAATARASGIRIASPRWSPTWSPTRWPTARRARPCGWRRAGSARWLPCSRSTTRARPSPPELLPRLFEPLTRGSPTGASTAAASGWGSTSSGRSSGPTAARWRWPPSREQGTTFTVRLPRS